MVYDPVFAATVKSNPATALKGLKFSANELGWLRATDTRAFGVDVHRRDRTLKALIDEYPRCTAIIFKRDGNLEGLAAFFEENEFHKAIQQRQHLAMAFGSYLERYAGKEEPDLVSLVVMESAIARLRRQSASEMAEDTGFILAPGAMLVKTVSGSLNLFSELSGRLAKLSTSLEEAALSGRVDIQGLPPIGTGRSESILLTAEHSGKGEVALELCPDALFRLLQCAEGGCTSKALLDCARLEGADEDEAEEILEGLVSDGILQRHSSPNV